MSIHIIMNGGRFVRSKLLKVTKATKATKATWVCHTSNPKSFEKIIFDFSSWNALNMFS